MKLQKIKIPQLLFLLVMVLAISGCRSKKVTVDKKEETVNELHKKNIKTSETTKFETNILDWSKSGSIKITPKDTSRPSKIIYKGDTLSLDNATVEINSTEAQWKETTTGSANTTATSNSSEEKSSQSKVQQRDSKVTAASWGLNLGVIFGVIAGLILLYLFFTTKKYR